MISFRELLSCDQISVSLKGIHPFFISNFFISNTMLKMAKNEAKAKQQPEAELLTKISKKKCVCFNEIT